ncbi:MAG: Na(+)-translocating NADH-quinone reductase subunit C [Aequoribacter sp.]|uniref:Na(+)-translocating NADH-quinone reductase subunit C n=1 Tax=Aequoribacter sp. TaxID=2847771 RepID=UPI003C629DB2
MSSKDGIGKVIGVALALCVVCSVVVSTAAVQLKPAQEINKTRDLKRNILQAAGLYDASQSVESQFDSISTRVVDLRTGRFTDEVDPSSFDQRSASKDPSNSAELDDEQDVAKISRREHYSLVYLVENSGAIEKIILPVRGYGLWSTLYGFVALESDANTVVGLGFYEHGETPGLGGEVDNPRWKAFWPGKQVYRDGDVEIALAKGAVDPASTDAPWRVDGLSGATLTSRGVTNLVQFWLGEDGFQPFLANLKAGEA